MHVSKAEPLTGTPQSHAPANDLVALQQRQQQQKEEKVHLGAVTAPLSLSHTSRQRHKGGFQGH